MKYYESDAVPWPMSEATRGGVRGNYNYYPQSTRPAARNLTSVPGQEDWSLIAEKSTQLTAERSMVTDLIYTKKALAHKIAEANWNNVEDSIPDVAVVATTPPLKDSTGAATAVTLTLLQRHGRGPGWRLLDRPVFFARKISPPSAIYLELKKAGTPVELHIFKTGGHGFGIREAQGSIARWPDLCADWFRQIGIVSSLYHNPGHWP